MKKLNQNGMVSLMTVVIFATIITVVLTIYAGITIKQQQEANNFDSSTRAFYAAESGFQDTVRGLGSTIIPSNYASSGNKKTDCKPVGDVDLTGVVSLSSDPNAAYTCQLIDFTPSQLSYGTIGENQSVLFPIIPEGGFSNTGSYSLTISWTPSSASRQATDKALTPKSYWNNNGAPPMIRGMFFWTPSSGSFTTSDIRNQSYFFNPTDPRFYTPDSPTVDLGGTGGVNGGKAGGGAVSNASCDDTSGCSTTVALNGASGHNLFVVLKPLYRSAETVTLTLKKDGNTVSFGSGQASIDITGKSGDTYRRIKQNVAYGEYTVKLIDFPDYSLVGGDGICKMMSLTASGNSLGCQP